MNNIVKTLTTIACFGMTGTALAVPVTVTFTGDNISGFGGYCLNGTDCVLYDSLVAGQESSLSNWQVATTYTVDLDAGNYWFYFGVENSGAGSSGNPAGMLGEITWDGNVSSSSSDWYAITSGGGWFVNAVEYSWASGTGDSSNGGDNIWNSVNNGPVAGISGDANWIWTDSNFNVEMDQAAVFYTRISVVPEPATLALFGLGLLGLGFARRRKA